MLATDNDGVRVRRFTVDEYHRMGDAGVFERGERVELIRGVIREMSPKGGRHVIAVSRATRLFVLAVAGRASVFVQDPLPSMRFQSEPEPDLWIASSPDPRHYGTDDAKSLLVLEVADSSREYDREVKAPLYAEIGVPEYWLVDLVDGVLEVFREPVNGRYTSRIVLAPGGQIATLAWPELEVRVEDLLP
jgi:Uma2 family endonuclease